MKKKIICFDIDNVVCTTFGKLLTLSNLWIE